MSVLGRFVLSSMTRWSIIRLAMMYIVFTVWLCCMCQVIKYNYQLPHSVPVIGVMVESTMIAKDRDKLMGKLRGLKFVDSVQIATEPAEVKSLKASTELMSETKPIWPTLWEMRLNASSPSSTVVSELEGLGAQRGIKELFWDKSAVQLLLDNEGMRTLSFYAFLAIWGLFGSVLFICIFRSFSSFIGNALAIFRDMGDKKGQIERFIWTSFVYFSISLVVFSAVSALILL